MGGCVESILEQQAHDALAMGIGCLISACFRSASYRHGCLGRVLRLSYYGGVCVLDTDDVCASIMLRAFSSCRVKSSRLQRKPRSQEGRKMRVLRLRQRQGRIRPELRKKLPSR